MSPKERPCLHVPYFNACWSLRGEFNRTALFLWPLRSWRKSLSECHYVPLFLKSEKFQAEISSPTPIVTRIWVNLLYMSQPSGTSIAPWIWHHEYGTMNIALWVCHRLIYQMPLIFKNMFSSCTSASYHLYRKCTTQVVLITDLSFFADENQHPFNAYSCSEKLYFIIIFFSSTCVHEVIRCRSHASVVEEHCEDQNPLSSLAYLQFLSGSMRRQVYIYGWEWPPATGWNPTTSQRVQDAWKFKFLTNALPKVHVAVDLLT